MQYSFINEEKPQDVFEHFYVVEHKNKNRNKNKNKNRNKNRNSSSSSGGSGGGGGSSGGSSGNNFGYNTQNTIRTNPNPPQQVPATGPGSRNYVYVAAEETICRSQRHSTDNRNYKNCRDRDCDIYNIHCPPKIVSSGGGMGFLSILGIMLGTIVGLIAAIIIGNNIQKSLEAS